ncbi:Arb2 domain-containing protein [Phyllosticta citricarpa]|uniref:Arb2 domain-containing protein n=1 Tax=Phyllosticta citricarpa TaxID=55181 RepID=A0ABR1MTM6_9PEZI
MYRLAEAGMPQDPHYNADLKELGYFIDANSEIKTIRPPHFYYPYTISNNDRVNDSFRDAMHECIMREIRERMAALGMPQLYVPQMSPDKPKNEPATPILVTNQQDLKKRKRIIVVINDDFQDLGMWAYRIASKEGGIEAGSVISLAKAMQANQVAHFEKLRSMGPGIGGGQDAPASDVERRVTEAVVAQAPHMVNGSEATKTDDLPKTDGADVDRKPAPTETTNVPFKVPEDWQAPGLVVLNLGQLLYSHRLDKAMTRQSWNSQPRKSAIHPVAGYDAEFNTIPGNRTVAEHVKFVFDNIVNNPEWVSRDANVYIIGNGNGGDAILDFLDLEWPTYKERVAAIALADPTPIRYPLKDRDFAAFLRHRARGLVPSTQPAGTPIAVPSSSEHPTPTSSRRESAASRRDSTASTGEPSRPQDKPASPWLEMVSSTGDSGRGFFSSASDALTSSISQLAIDSILASPTTPLRTMPDASIDWGMHYFPLLSSGEPSFGELIVPTSYRLVLAWFELVAGTPGYKNPAFRVPEVAPQVFDTETNEPLKTDVGEGEGEGGVGAGVAENADEGSKGKQRAEEA